MADAGQPINGTSLTQAVTALPDARLVWSPSVDPADARSDSSSHGGFDDDNPTMTSVLLRILRTTTVEPGNSYTPNLTPGTTPEGVAAQAADLADQPPDVTTADVTGGGTPGPATPAAAAAPAKAESTATTPEADPGNRTIQALEQEGWKREPAPGEAITASAVPRRRSPSTRPSSTKARKNR